MRRAAVVCVLLAAASLALSATPGFDASGWVLWGRELAGHGAFSTVSYPSWKPLPALVNTVFAALSPSAVPALWLVVSRASGLLAIVLDLLRSGMPHSTASKWLNWGEGDDESTLWN